MLLTNNSPDLCALCSEKNNFLPRIPGISANSNENYGRYNFLAFADVSRNFEKISGNIKFPENLQPYT